MKAVKRKNDAFVEIKHVRVNDQRKVMEQIIADGKCPFCSDNLHLYHKKPILKEEFYWILTENQWPYKNSKVHLLAIYKEHAENLGDIVPEAGKELLELFQWVQNNYDSPGGAVVMRFGDLKYSAGTVKHVHAHFLQPDVESPTYTTVQFQIGHAV